MPASGARPVRTGLLVLTLALAVTALSLLQSLVVPILPTIGEQLGVGAGAAGWVLTANLLAAAVLTPVIGRLGDTVGERPVVLGVLGVVAVGTLLAVRTTSLPLLLVARVLQGASYGLFPLSISILRRELPAGRLTVAMSVVSSTLAVGGVIGLVVTGVLTRDGGDYVITRIDIGHEATDESHAVITVSTRDEESMQRLLMRLQTRGVNQTDVGEARVAPLFGAVPGAKRAIESGAVARSRVYSANEVESVRRTMFDESLPP